MSVSVGCSLVTSWDGLPLDTERASLLDGGVARDAAPDGGGDASQPEAAVDATPPAEAGACPRDGYFCGGDQIVGDPSTLYRCGSATGTPGPVKVMVCQHGCARRVGEDDVCVCVVGSSYCGGDQVIGDPQSIYECGADYSPKLVQQCPKQCVVVAGQDDACR